MKRMDPTQWWTSLPTGRLIAGFLSILISGCAAQQAFKEGQNLAGQGRAVEALAKFEEASGLDRGSAEYRMAVIRTKEIMLLDLLDRAEASLRANRLPEAKTLFTQVLGLQPGNARAQTGIRQIELRGQHARMLLTARELINSKDTAGALSLAQAILAEDPSHVGARVLKAQLQPPTPPMASTLSKAYRTQITIEFRDAPLYAVFEVISRTSGLNFIFDKDIKTDQRTSLFLKNSTIEAAVNMTLLTNQLEQRVMDENTILIYPNTQAKQKDYQALSVKTFYLSNAEAKSVANTLKTILKTRDVVFDEKLNLLVVRDTPQALKLAEKLVAVHDVPEPEVMLEVEILEVKRTRLLDLGVRWPDQLSLTPLPAEVGGTLTWRDLRSLNSARLGATLGATSLHAKSVDTDANILANPRIRSRNREKAKILIGERLPNITTTATATGFVSESVTYVDVGLKLDVEPTIYPDGEVAIKVALEVSNVVNQIQTKSGAIAYQIGTRTAQTVLRLKDGENQVLAGLINDEDRRSAYKVPGLGEVPVLGRLFGSQADDAIKTEIVLSITPRIIRNIKRPNAAILEFDSGTEGSMRAPSGGREPSSAADQDKGSSGAKAPSALAPTEGRGSALDRSALGPGAIASGSTGGFVGGPGPGVGPSGAQGQLQWLGPTQAKLGSTFALQIQMQAAQPVVSVPMAIGFDPKVLQVVSVVEGDFLRQNGAKTTFASRVDPAGQIIMTGTRTGDTGASAAANFATVTFRVQTPTPTPSEVRVLTVAPVVLGGGSLSLPLPPPFSISAVP